MQTDFKNIKVIIWDFDGTLYPPNTALWEHIRESELKAIMKYLKVSMKEAEEKFYAMYKIVTPSATETVASLVGIPVSQVAVEIETRHNRRKFLKPDPRLPGLFTKLKKFTHYMLANGSIDQIRETLPYLGLSPDIFREIVTSETVGATKPHPAGFRYIMKKTKLPSCQHLMVGDREQVDLLPAKNLGMKTCLVWSDKKSKIADMTLPNIYKLPTIF